MNQFSKASNRIQQSKEEDRLTSKQNCDQCSTSTEHLEIKSFIPLRAQTYFYQSNFQHDNSQKIRAPKTVLLLNTLKLLYSQEYLASCGMWLGLFLRSNLHQFILP